MKFRPAFAALVAALATAAIAVPTISNAGLPPSQLAFNEKVISTKFVQHAKATKGIQLAPGDSIVTRQSLFDDSDMRVGTLFTDCTNVGAKAQVFRAALSCNLTYRLASGDIVGSGVATLNDPDAEFAVVGGTGDFQGVGGTASALPPEDGYDSRDQIDLTD